jgi:hypothetical protein
VSRTSRAALVVFAAVLAVLALFHLLAPQWMSSLAHAIHGR